MKRETADVVSMMEHASDELRTAILDRVLDLVMARASANTRRMNAKVIQLFRSTKPEVRS